MGVKDTSDCIVYKKKMFHVKHLSLNNVLMFHVKHMKTLLFAVLIQNSNMKTSKKVKENIFI